MIGLKRSIINRTEGLLFQSTQNEELAQADLKRQPTHRQSGSSLLCQQQQGGHTDEAFYEQVMTTYLINKFINQLEMKLNFMSIGKRRARKTQIQTTYSQYRTWMTSYADEEQFMNINSDTQYQ